MTIVVHKTEINERIEEQLTQIAFNLDKESSLNDLYSLRKTYGNNLSYVLRDLFINNIEKSDKTRFATPEEDMFYDFNYLLNTLTKTPVSKEEFTKISEGHSSAMEALNNYLKADFLSFCKLFQYEELDTHTRPQSIDDKYNYYMEITSEQRKLLFNQEMDFILTPNKTLFTFGSDRFMKIKEIEKEILLAKVKEFV